MKELWIKERKVCSALKVAAKVTERMKGRLRTNDWSDCDGFLIPSCKMIHTFFMKYPMDVLFCDKKGEIVKSVKGLKPNGVSGCFKASLVVELPRGAIEGFNINVGEKIKVQNGRHKT